MPRQKDELQELVHAINNRAHQYHRKLQTNQAHLPSETAQDSWSSHNHAMVCGIPLHNTNGKIQLSNFQGFQRDIGISFPISSEYGPHRSLSSLSSPPRSLEDLWPFPTTAQRRRWCCPLTYVDWSVRGGLFPTNIPCFDTNCYCFTRNRRKFGDLLYADDERLLLYRDSEIPPGLCSVNENYCALSLVSLGCYPCCLWHRSTVDVLLFWRSRHLETNEILLNVSLVRKTWSTETIVWTYSDLCAVTVTKAETSPNIHSNTSPYTFLLHFFDQSTSSMASVDVSNLPNFIRRLRWNYFHERRFDNFYGDPEEVIRLIESYIPMARRKDVKTILNPAASSQLPVVPRL
jgi:hypothetical protein